MWNEPKVRLKCLNFIYVNLDPIKGVDSFRQMDGDHGSWLSAKECVITHHSNELALKMDDA